MNAQEILVAIHSGELDVGELREVAANALAKCAMFQDERYPARVAANVSADALRIMDGWRLVKRTHASSAPPTLSPMKAPSR